MRERHKMCLMTVSSDSVIKRLPEKEFETLKRRSDFERKTKKLKIHFKKEIKMSQELIDFSNKVADQIRLFKLNRMKELTTNN